MTNFAAVEVDRPQFTGEKGFSAVDGSPETQFNSWIALSYKYISFAVVGGFVVLVIIAVSAAYAFEAYLDMFPSKL